MAEQPVLTSVMRVERVTRARPTITYMGQPSGVEIEAVNYNGVQVRWFMPEADAPRVGDEFFLILQRGGM